MGPVTKCQCGRGIGLGAKKRVLQPHHTPLWFCSFKCSEEYKIARDKILREWLNKQ